MTKFPGMTSPPSGLVALTKLFCGILLAAVFLGLLLFNPPVHADNKPKLEDFSFSRDSGSARAMIEAKKVYKSHLGKLAATGGLADGATPDDDFDGIARYVPLQDGKPTDFLGLLIFNAPDQECQLAGCSFFIFKRQSGNNWQTVMTVSTHEVFLGQAPKPGEPRDIFLRSHMQAPWEPGSNKMGQWRWADDGYKFYKLYEP